MKALDLIRRTRAALRENPEYGPLQIDTYHAVLRAAPRLIAVAEAAERVVVAWEKWSRASDDTTGRVVDAEAVTQAAGEYDAAVARLVEAVEDGR